MNDNETRIIASQSMGIAIGWFLGKMMKAASEKRITKSVFPSLASPGDKSGSRISFYSDKDGNVGISPRQARRNVYRDAFLLNGRSEAEADKAADDDFEKANLARYRNLSNAGYGSMLGKFDRNLNYALGPHQTEIRPLPSETNGTWASFAYGRLDDSIPLYELDSIKDPNAIGSIRPSRSNYIRPGGRKIPMSGGFDRISLNPKHREIGKYVVLHEGGHSAAQPLFATGSKGGATFLERDKNTNVKGDHYAVDAAEMAVAVLHEKAMMRALGRNVSSGMGREWSKEILGNWSKYGRYSYRDADTNVYSLRRMLYELSTRANSKKATSEDKKRYQDFLDRMDYEFEQVFDRLKNQKNGISRQKSRRGIA